MYNETSITGFTYINELIHILYVNVSVDMQTCATSSFMSKWLSLIIHRKNIRGQQTWVTVDKKTRGNISHYMYYRNTLKIQPNPDIFLSQAVQTRDT